MGKRQPPNRSTDATIGVYLTTAQKEALERAAAKAVEGLPGARMPVYVFVLQAALEKAKAMGIEVEE